MTPIKRYISYVFSCKRPLIVRAIWGGCQASVSLGYRVERVNPETGSPKWDGRRCVKNTTHGKQRVPASTINRALDIMEERIDKVFAQFELQDAVPTVEEFKRLLNPDAQQAREEIWPDTMAFLSDGEELHQWAENTLKSVRTVLRLVRMFDAHPRYAAINQDWLDRFVRFQQTHSLGGTHSASGKGYANKVIEKNCRVLKWFLKWAAQKGKLSPDMVGRLHVSLKKIDKPVIFLKWDQLIRLYEYPFEAGSEFDRCRDFFCFCCFSSLRYSDAAALLRSQISDDVMTIPTQKTSDMLHIDLNKYTRAILAKYPAEPKGAALPFFTVNRLNYMVKEMGRILGFDHPVHLVQYYGARREEKTVPFHSLLSSHAGRRTFICNALSLGIAPNIVMKWTGHSDYNAMRPYIDIADEIRKESMSLFDRK